MQIIWDKIINIGIQDNLSFEEANKIKIINGVCFFLLLVNSFRFFDALYFEEYPRAIFNLLSFLINIAVFYLQYLRLYILVRYFIFISSLILVVFYIFGNTSIQHIYYLFFMMITVFIFFDKLHTIIILFLIVSVVFLFLLIWLQLYPERIYLAIKNFNYLPVVMTLVLIFFSVYYFKSSYLIFAKSLKNKNNLLQQQKEEIEIQAENLIKINQSKDKLFSILGHDLRAPVNNLKSLFHLLHEDSLTQADFFEISQKLRLDIDNLHITLSNLLEWSQSQLGGMQTNAQLFDLNEAIIQNIQLYKSIAENKQIELKTFLPESNQVFADENQIKLVLRNLIGNAVKFTPDKGKIIIKSEKEGDKTIFRIQDTGMGISPENLQKLFDVNHSITQKGTRGEIGTGLGLLLCQEMVKHNQGEINVQSQLGIGTVFSIILPTDYRL